MATATGVQAAFWPYAHPSPFVIFVGAVVVAACLGGLLAGGLASVLSLSVGIGYFLPTYTNYPHPHRWPSTVLTGVFFLGISAVVVAMLQRLHAARKRAEQAMSERLRIEETRARFVDILAHDLRNPLAVIRLSAQLQLQQEDLPRVASDAFARTARSAERMLHLVDQLLDLARSRTTAGFPLQRGPVSIAEVCRDTLNELGESGSDSSVVLDVVADTVGAWDGDRLAQVVHNLISNAMRFRTPDTRVRVRVEREDGWAVLSIENQAAMIPAEALAYLFEPFRSCAAGAAKASVGLGLYISKVLVLAHGGTITARSDVRATCFTVRLPEVAPAPADVAFTQDPGPSSGSASSPHLALSS